MELLQELVKIGSKKNRKCVKCTQKVTKKMCESVLNSDSPRDLIYEWMDTVLSEEVEQEVGSKILRLKDDIEHPMAAKIAKTLGVHDGGHAKKLGSNLFATYMHGGDLTFYSNAHDIQHDLD